jgi:ubiquinone/menaquinone biosynthesis C-methylase UbiE
MDDRKAFFNSTADNWETMSAEGERQQKIVAVAKWFDIEQSQSVLDVGTGTGVLLPNLIHRVGPEGKVVGIDFSFSMLEKARKHLEERGLSIANAGVGAIPFRAETFDRVTCFSAFPHFPDKPRALTEMARVLKPGGVLFVAHMHSSEEIAGLHGSVGGAVKKDHLPDSGEMIRLMEASGLVEVSVENVPGKYLARGRRSDAPLR